MGQLGEDTSPLGMSRDELAAWLARDPAELARMAAEVMQQGGPDAPIGEFNDLNNNRALSGQLKALGYTDSSRIYKSVPSIGDDDRLLSLLETIFGPYYPTGKVIERRHYAPIFDLRLGFNVDQTIKSAVTYKTEEKHSGSIAFKAKGVASTLKFSRDVTVDNNFAAIAGDQQITLPVLMRFREYENHYQPTDKRYSATVLRVYDPIQSTPGGAFFTAVDPVDWGNTGHPIGSAASKLNKTETVADGVSLENTITLDFGEERSVEMSYTAEQNSSLSVSITSERAGHFWQEFGNGSQMIRRIDQIADQEDTLS